MSFQIWKCDLNDSVMAGLMDLKPKSTEAESITHPQSFDYIQKQKGISFPKPVRGIYSSFMGLFLLPINVSLTGMMFFL